jgi:hypothetical protein
MKTVYDKASGEILKYIANSDDDFVSLNTRPQMGICDTEYNSRSWYFDNDEPKERPLQETTLDKTTILSSGSDAATFSDMPVPSIVTVYNETIGEETVAVFDGQLEFFASVPGTYYVKVISFPFVDYEAVIHAV